MNYQFQPGFILEKLPELAVGLKFTLIVSAIGIAGALAIGILAAACRSERLPLLDGLVKAYVELFRNTRPSP